MAGALYANGGPPFSGYLSETPASLACIYQLVWTWQGCNPKVLQAFSAQLGIRPISPHSFQVLYASAGVHAFEAYNNATSTATSSLKKPAIARVKGAPPAGENRAARVSLSTRTTADLPVVSHLNLGGRK